MNNSGIHSSGFHQAELRSEGIRVKALLLLLAGLLLLVVARGGISLTQGHTGEVWPFTLALLIMTTYEVVWLKYIKQIAGQASAIPVAMWKTSVFAESLLPTAALILQMHTSFIGPVRALTSPVVLIYLLFILLSTLHLDPALSKLCGVFSTAGYVLVVIYATIRFPSTVRAEAPVVYATCSASAALLLLGGFAAAAVAGQIRLHVMTSLDEVAERARMTRDLEVARTIQQGLLPNAPPDIPGFDIAGWNQPADQTGGDYFDWQKLPDGQFAVSIADVSGHGIGPALCMASCRAYARVGFLASAALPEIMSDLNQLVYEDLPSERFVTLAAGLLDPDSSTLELISAGHGPLLCYLAAEDRFRSYDPQGPPLGLMPQLAYGNSHMVKLNSGDIFVFVTDGFIEWMNAEGNDFGKNRLKEVIRGNRGKPARTIISELYASLKLFVGNAPQPDDLTVVIIKRT